MIPRTPDAITADWLTWALREAGTMGEARVTAVSGTVLENGSGFTGQLARLSIGYDRDAPSLPASLIAKLPGTHPETRRLTNAFHVYPREIDFYRHLAPVAGVRTPRHYYSAIDAPPGDCILLLEDLAPARCGDQLQGCSSADAERVVRELARLHAAWWGDPRLDQFDWMPAFDSYLPVWARVISQTWPLFRAGIGNRIPEPALAVWERAIRNPGFAGRPLSRAPRTIVHRDFRLDNLFFTGDADQPLAVIDWQLVSRGRGAYDLAYFLTGNLNVQHRRTAESGLIRMYHGALEEAGVADYSLDSCLADYRLALLHELTFWVPVLASLDFTTERGQAFLATVLARLVAAIEDHELGALLPSLPL